MEPRRFFQHCPRCGVRAPENAESKESTFRCASCGFLYYFNPCCAVAGFILNSQNEMILLRRAKEPAKGKLAVPGGFIDIGETAEVALRRETREEVDLELETPKFLCSQVNSYHYREVTYPVLDLFFVARTLRPEVARPLDGVDSFVWSRPADVNLDDIAFPSIREALRQFVAGDPPICR